MITISKTEVNTCLAEMRGWEVYAGYWGDNYAATYSLDEWNPTKRVEQAIECLEAYGHDAGIAYSVKDGYCVSIYGVAIKLRAVHKDLEVAICTALCSAIKGEQCEVER